MQIELELLAPAKNKSIGIAAIDCGADAVYIAGPKFGAREAAGNTIEDIAQLAAYAHKYGAKVYMVVNTILYDNELQEAKQSIIDAYNAGCDAIIIQDLGLLMMDLPPIELHASTQTNIRTVEQAKFLESLGFGRLILARELITKQIGEIKESTNTELESFIHGALCVSYSGQCYLSQKITGRSANRGCCAQACRSDYSLIDATGELVRYSNGKPLVKNQPILSLKDLNLSNKISQVIKSGITSFKIEGRLKNESYIRNIVLHYRRIIDKFILENNGYRRASLGVCTGGFTTNPYLTFNRGYTELFIDSQRGKWNSKDGAKYLGEFIGNVTSCGTNKYGQLTFNYKLSGKQEPINNGDGLCFVTPNGEIYGARANTTNGNTVATTEKLTIPKESKIFRNFNISFEKSIEKNPPKRTIFADITFIQQQEQYTAVARLENGIEASYTIAEKGEVANNPQLAKENIIKQLGKTSDHFCFTVTDIDVAEIPFFPASVLNNARRELAALLHAKIENESKERRLAKGEWFVKNKQEKLSKLFESADAVSTKNLSYLANCSNNLSNTLYTKLGAKEISPAYELEQAPSAELMRTKYCIKYELGLCPNFKTKWGLDKNYKNNIDKIKFTPPLYLLNGKNKLELKFDCTNCEMLIIG